LTKCNLSRLTNPVTYVPLPDPNEIRDCDLASPEMVEGARLVECGERQLRMLRRMGDVGIELVERLGQIAMSGAGSASGDGAATITAPATIDSIAGAYVKLTQSLRRTLAMETRLSDELKARRLGVVATRNKQHAEKIKVVEDLVTQNIDYALTKAIRRERPDTDRETNERLLMDMFERLKDSDDFEDYRELPPGETVARLCATFGLDPEFCIQADDETWMIRHGNLPPSHSWGGTDRNAIRVGPVTESDAGVLPHEPHPDGYAVCPSP
jgi:hypothetical protein